MQSGCPRSGWTASLSRYQKKGNLSSCDNWRGIALLEVVGKAVAGLVQTRLQRLAEDILPDTQCGFRKGRSCADMIFAVRQISEKLYEHRCSGFMVFVDLRKAYDSVTRKCMWEILRKAGVPDKLVTIISSFHTSMSANLSIPGIEAEPIEVQNGLRQGCCMAPVLFNIFMWAVFQLWQREVADMPEIGLPVSSNSGPSLLFKRQKTDTINIHRDCQFADDSALIATTHHGATLALSRFMDVATRFGLTINLSKTKVMAVGFGISPEDRRPLVVGGEIVENVHDFRYLGSIIHTGGRTAVDTRSRIASASRAFGAVRRSVFDDGDLSLATKRMVYDACVASLLLYGAECWVPLKSELATLSAFHLRCISAILALGRRDTWDFHINRKTILEAWNRRDPVDITTRVLRRRLEWLGHLARMDGDRTPRQLLFGALLPPRPACGPRKRWRDSVRADLSAVNIDHTEWYDLAQERGKWRSAYSAQPVPRSAQRDTSVLCDVCQRTFAHQKYKNRHKCLAERRKPISEQSGSRLCNACGRWFLSAGGLASHKCLSNSAAEVASVSAVASADSVRKQRVALPCCRAHCLGCGRCCKSSRGFYLHSCANFLSRK